MKIIFKVKRFLPSKDKESHWEEYQLKVEEGTTVLDALIQIKETIDPTLSMRYSCRMGICGSCGMLINGKPDLACHKQVGHLGTPVVAIEPMPNYPLIKDLVPDMGSMFHKHRKIKPYLIRKDTAEQENPTREFKQLPSEQEQYLQFSYCIKCGLCVTSCPPASTDEEFLGPFVLTQAYRYIVDTRDEGIEERLKILDTPHSVWNCHFATGCSYACPKGVDPALAIQFLKKTAVFKNLGFLKKKKGAVLVPELPEKGPNRDKIPKPPEPTV